VAAGSRLPAKQGGADEWHRASTGTLLSASASPSAIPNEGSAAITVTIPAGVSGGSHTVYAIGSAGSAASATITVYIDTVAPSVGATVLAKTQGGNGGYLKQGGTYFVYANVTDGGTPTSGVQTVTTNVSSLSSGQTAVALSSGSFTVDGTSYNYRSASLTAKQSPYGGVVHLFDHFIRQRRQLRDAERLRRHRR
jgi:hypothetical protein